MIRQLFRTLGRLVGLLGAGLAAKASKRLPPRSSLVDMLAGTSKTKRRMVKGGMIAAVLALGGFLVAASGIVPIKASSGHWDITAWFLNFSMSRSVSTHSMGVKAPPLDDPALVLKGAGHYESGCRPCHGGPGLASPRIPRQMTPHPPNLVEMVPQWKPDELFYIVKHGVKFTGMPAWPARERDDEVWAVVAFLLEFPDMDRGDYMRLVHGTGAPADDADRTRAPVGARSDATPPPSPAGPDTARSPSAAGTATSGIADTIQGTAPPGGDVAGEDAAVHGLLEPDNVPQTVTESCGRCHGADGAGRGTGAFPKLAGQRPVYLFAALRAYQRGARHSGIMEPVAAGMTVDEMREAALYYAALDPSASRADSAGPEGSIDRGREIVERGIPEQRVPSCADCHGPAQIPHNRAYPRLGGQYADYLVLQLEIFKQDRRGGSAYAHLMQPVAEKLTSQQMRDVALYYESLGSSD